MLVLAVLFVLLVVLGPVNRNVGCKGVIELFCDLTIRSGEQIANDLDMILESKGNIKYKHRIYFVFVFFALVALLIREERNEVILDRGVLRSGRVADGNVLREDLDVFVQGEIVEDAFVLGYLLQICVAHQQDLLVTHNLDGFSQVGVGKHEVTV